MSIAEVIHAIAAAVALILGAIFEMRRGSDVDSRIAALDSRTTAIEATIERFRRNL